MTDAKTPDAPTPDDSPSPAEAPSAAEAPATPPAPPPAEAPATPPLAPAPAAAAAASKEERSWAMFCHLIGFVGYVFPFGNVIGPLVLWLLKREELPLVDDQGKEALNFQITWTILFIIGIGLVFIAIGILILPLMMLVHAILMIIATVKANEGVRYRYPAILRFIS